jgi:hypothetical protein
MKEFYDKIEANPDLGLPPDAIKNELCYFGKIFILNGIIWEILYETKSNSFYCKDTNGNHQVFPKVIIDALLEQEQEASELFD